MSRKYIDIAKKIREQIDSGMYKPGESLPPRLELARDFSVARATIDKCIDFMVSNGTLISRQGSGTYVNSDFSTDGYRIAFMCSNSSIQEIKAECSAKLSFVALESLNEKSARTELLKYDGLLWYRPEQLVLEWIDELKDKVPQVIINRTVDDYYCVSTDHKGAYKEITMERLELCPDVFPYFINDRKYGMVGNYREKGFIEACREKGRFYETVNVSRDFEERIKELNESIEIKAGKTILLVSSSLFYTGSVIFWAREKNLKWQRDIYYSDFDNNSDTNVWGVKVTSYMQNDNMVLSTAIKTIVELVSGKVPQQKHVLIFPERIFGDT